jgi:hypothetical protein
MSRLVVGVHLLLAAARDSSKGDGGWLVAGLAAIALGAGAFVAWRAFGRSDPSE